MNIEAKIIIFLSPKAFYFIFFYPYKKIGQRQGQTASFKKKIRAAESALSYFFVLLQPQR